MPKKNKKQEDQEQQLAEITADLQRIHADYTNYKRRAEEDRIRAVSIGREGTIVSLLPTIDNIQRALMHIPKDLKNHKFINGLQTVAKQLEKDLKDIGVVKIKTIGQEFDPEFMEAVHMDDGEGEKEVVVEEIQSGFTLNGQVIRHAMVKVGKE